MKNAAAHASLELQSVITYNCNAEREREREKAEINACNCGILTW